MFYQHIERFKNKNVYDYMPIVLYSFHSVSKHYCHISLQTESLYCNDFLGRKINLSKISLAKRSRSGPNSVYVDMSRGDDVQVILGAIGPFWGKQGLGRVPQSASFFCVVNQTTFQQLRNGYSTKFGHEKYFGVPTRNPERHFRKFSLQGSFAPKICNQKSVKQEPHSEQATGHWMHCREILFTPRCSPRAIELLRSVNFSLRRTVAELWGVKVAKFLDFGLFSPYVP